MTNGNLRQVKAPTHVDCIGFYDRKASGLSEGGVF